MKRTQTSSFLNINDLKPTTSYPPSLTYKNTLKRLNIFAKSRSLDVFLHGESGTGKSHLAKECHRLSGRPGPFIRVHAPSLSPDLVESELFGHCKGVFTGADSDRTGLFKQADNGTLFFDEIADIPLSIQAKLLQVIDEKSFRPVGASHEESVDLKLIFATNKDLAELVKRHEIRDDFLFRIQKGQVSLPPLRGRQDDINYFTRVFLHQYIQEECAAITFIKSDALNLLLQYSWPGNIRELAATIQRAVITAESNVIETTNIELDTAPNDSDSTIESYIRSHSLEEVIAMTKSIHYRYAMDSNNKNIGRAAESLGISVRQFRRWGQNAEKIVQ